MSYTNLAYKTGVLAHACDFVGASSIFVVYDEITSISALERFKAKFEGGVLGSVSRANVHLQLWHRSGGNVYRATHVLYDAAGLWKQDNFLILHSPFQTYSLPGPNWGLD